MTQEEIRYNKKILLEVSKAKKDGQLENIFEHCTSKTVTKYD